MNEVGTALKNDELAKCDSELGCINRYRNVMREKAALIVVDDVWRAGDVEPFRPESRHSRLLFTTRDACIAAAVGAEELIADLLTSAQSREMLARWSGSKTRGCTVRGRGHHRRVRASAPRPPHDRCHATRQTLGLLGTRPQSPPHCRPREGTVPRLRSHGVYPKTSWPLISNNLERL